MAHCIPVNAYSDLLALHCAHPARYPYLLESVARGGASARYDILFAFPGETLALSDMDCLTGAGLTVSGNDFLANLDSWWQLHRLSENPLPQLPFSGGWFVYLGYELAAQIEPKLIVAPHTGLLPVAFATRIRAAFIRDHLTQQIFLVAEQGQEALLDTMMADLKTSTAALSKEPAPFLVALINEEAPEKFLQGIQRIHRYIKEGDVFQVNLSRLWQASLEKEACAATLYRHLREQNPAPFAGLITYQDAAIISSSPERLVKVRDGVVETRPIAGTRPRQPATQADLSDLQALLAHPKERAEHIMLIDLERNDLGRVCLPGSVKVDELMSVESYAHVHHIVSNISGRLREVTPGEVLRAVFPGGTITGCPKVRCMEIIAELEQAPRAAYTGSVGYINRDGSMDFNILIRTFMQQGRQITLRAGAGIVADSQPERELEETRAKARGLLLALTVNGGRP